MFKYAFSTLACPNWSAQDVIAAATRFAYDGVELRLLDGDFINPTVDARKVDSAVTSCRNAGIDGCVLGTSCRLNQHDPTERSAVVEELRRWIALAHAVSVPILRVFGGAGSSEVSDAAQDRHVVEVLQAVAEEAEAAGVTVALETHDAFSSAKRVGRILDAVQSPSAAALWDSHHPFRLGETADEVAAALGTRIAHVHFKDARRVTSNSDQWQLVLIGEGEVPVREQLDALARQQYSAYVSVEWEKKWHPALAEPETALPQHITWLRGVDSYS
jgi:fatty-acyl-CoA synthase